MPEIVKWVGKSSETIFNCKMPNMMKLQDFLNHSNKSILTNLSKLMKLIIKNSLMKHKSIMHNTFTSVIF